MRSKSGAVNATAEGARDGARMFAFVTPCRREAICAALAISFISGCGRTSGS